MSQDQAEVWVRPLRITTAEGDTVHGGLWPDGRVYAWDASNSFVEAWPDQHEFGCDATENNWTVEWAPEVYP